MRWHLTESVPSCRSDRSSPAKGGAPAFATKFKLYGLGDARRRQQRRLGEVPQNGNFLRRVEGLSCGAGGRNTSSAVFNQNQRVLVRTDEDGPFLVGLACLLSKGALFVGLGATPMPCDKVPKCAVWARAGRYARDCQSSRYFRRYARARPTGGAPRASSLRAHRSRGPTGFCEKISFDEQYLFSLRWRERAQKGKGCERGPGHRGPSSLRGRTRRPPAASAPVNRPGPGGLAAGFALAAACALALRKSGCVGPEALPVSTVSRKEPDTQERRGKAAGTERAIAAGA